MTNRLVLLAKCTALLLATCALTAPVRSTTHPMDYLIWNPRWAAGSQLVSPVGAVRADSTCPAVLIGDAPGTG